MLQTAGDISPVMGHHIPVGEPRHFGGASPGLSNLDLLLAKY